jgi:hypothetical protein
VLKTLVPIASKKGYLLKKLYLEFYIYFSENNFRLILVDKKKIIKQFTGKMVDLNKRDLSNFDMFFMVLKYFVNSLSGLSKTPRKDRYITFCFKGFGQNTNYILKKTVKYFVERR